MGMFGLSPDEAQQQIQQDSQNKALTLSQLNGNQLDTYNGSLTGDMLGHGLDSLFGNENPAMAKAKKLQAIQQQTEQDAPFTDDPEKHMLLGIKNLVGAGFNAEAESGYKHYLEMQKQNASNMNAQSMAANTKINVDKQSREQAANNSLPDLLQTLNQPTAPSNETAQFTDSKEATQKAILNIPDAEQQAKVQAAFDAQYSFKPKYSEDSIQQLVDHGGSAALATAKHYEAINEQDHKVWDRTNNVSANITSQNESIDARHSGKVEANVTHGTAGLAPDEINALSEGVRSGKLDPNRINGKTAKLYAQMLLDDPNTNMVNLNADVGGKKATIIAFDKGKQGDTVRSLNVGISHLGTLKELTVALNNGDAKLINSLSQRFKAETGNAAPTNFDTAKRLISGEVVKAIVGAGGTGQDRQDAAESISRANSPEQIMGGADTYIKLFGGQLSGLEKQYKAGTNRDDFRDKYLTNESRKALGVGIAAPPKQAAQPAQPQYRLIPGKNPDLKSSYEAF